MKIFRILLVLFTVVMFFPLSGQDNPFNPDFVNAINVIWVKILAVVTAVVTAIQEIRPFLKKKK